MNKKPKYVVAVLNLGYQ